MFRFGDGGPDRCSLGPKRSLESIVFSLKSPCLSGERGVEGYVLGLQCQQSDCNFWLEWFIWINGTWGAYPKSKFGDESHGRCSMSQKRSFDSVFFSLKSRFQRGVERYVVGL